MRAAIRAAALLILPELVLRPWIGADEAGATGAKLAGRGLRQGRDLALAVGPFLAMRHDAPVPAGGSREGCSRTSAIRSPP